MADATATKTKPAEDQKQPGTDLVNVAPARLGFPKGLEERFGVDRAGWKALCESVFPSAKTPDAIVLALSYCKARKLDPFKKPVHIVPIWDSARGGYVESVWPGIGEHRTTAFRTKTYAGMDAAAFGPDVTETFKDKVRDGNAWREIEAKVTFPAWAQITVYRVVLGERVPFPGQRIYWKEFYSRIGRSSVPNERWQKAPYQMIEKCAEASALRRAFPEELGEEWTAEEAGFLGGTDARDITPGSDGKAPPEPTRAQFRGKVTDIDEGGDSGVDKGDANDRDQQRNTQEQPSSTGDQPAGTSADAGPASQAGAGDSAEVDWVIPNGPTEKLVEAASDMISEFETAADEQAFRDANAELFKKWGTGKPGSGYANALAAVESAIAEKVKELAASTA